MKAKLKADDKRLKEAVIHYNQLLPYGSTCRPAALTVEELSSATPAFPWAMDAVQGA